MSKEEEKEDWRQWGSDGGTRRRWWSDDGTQRQPRLRQDVAGHGGGRLSKWGERAASWGPQIKKTRNKFNFIFWVSWLRQGGNS